MKTKRFISLMSIFIGVMLLMIATVTVYRGLDEEKKANEAADTVYAELSEVIESSTEASDTDVDMETEPVEVLPDYVINPNKEMPVSVVDCESYIGILEVPSIGLSLSVFGEYDESALNISVVRYMGSVYQDNMIIAGHNYKRHFASLKNVQVGAEVLFTDVDGNVFAYSVSEIEIIDGNDVTSMINGDGWDLTLFTCTTGGLSRLTLRCVRSE